MKPDNDTMCLLLCHTAKLVLDYKYEYKLCGSIYYIGKERYTMIRVLLVLRVLLVHYEYYYCTVVLDDTAVTMQHTESQ